MYWLKKILKGSGWFFIIFLVAMLASVFSDRWFFPWLFSFPQMSRFQFLQKFNEKTTIINKTEQVIVKEENSFLDVSEKIEPSLVKIIASFEEKPEQLIKINQDKNLLSRVGTLITSDGLVMSWADEATGKYFLQNKNLKYYLLFSNNKRVEADLVGYDEYSQLVFYKIKTAGNWTVPLWGNTKNIASGDKLIMVTDFSEEGQPEAIIASLKKREEDFSFLNSNLSFSEKIQGAFILDSLINVNEENVGSPVINLDGELVGILGLTEKNGQKNIFILPLDLIEETIKTIIRDGTVERASLGVYFLPINLELALANNLPKNEGALVYSFSSQQGLAVLKNSSADLAGIKIGDIITELAGEKITKEKSLPAILSLQKKGTLTSIKLIRDKKELELKVTLE